MSSLIMISSEDAAVALDVMSSGKRWWWELRTSETLTETRTKHPKLDYIFMLKLSIRAIFNISKIFEI